MTRYILVTGGAGYIGSHATLALCEAGYDVVVLDNLSNGSSESLRRIAQICGRLPLFIQGDIRDGDLLGKIFAEYSIDAVLHFAGLKAVSESLSKPLEYYQNNVTGTIQLCKTMKKAGVYKLVFSSSATVYGEPSKMPISEDFPTGVPINPYGRSKLMVEEILKDLVLSDARWRIALLRYFNPIGSHPSGLIGEDPNGIPGNLLPCISQVAVGKLKTLSVYGGDYATRDGTGVRDYIHVIDLVNGHLKALEYINHNAGLNVWNLGTGQGYSVLEIIRVFEQVSGRKIPYQLVPRRLGDIAECWANPKKAFDELGWRPKLVLKDMITDAWRWQSQNPAGYLSVPTSIVVNVRT